VLTKIGAITISQSPRDDIIPDLKRLRETTAIPMSLPLELLAQGLKKLTFFLL
jgi:hypothetical protein